MATKVVGAGLDSTIWSDARGAFLDNINNAQLALITATHITNLDALTAARAAFLDNIDNSALALIKDKTTQTYQSIPASEDYSAVSSGAGDGTYGSWVQMIASTGSNKVITSVFVAMASTNDENIQLEIGTGASPAAVISVAATLCVLSGNIRGNTFTLPVPFYVPSGTKISCRIRDGSGSAFNYRCWIQTLESPI